MSVSQQASSEIYKYGAPFVSKLNFPVNLSNRGEESIFGATILRLRLLIKRRKLLKGTNLGFRATTSYAARNFPITAIRWESSKVNLLVTSRGGTLEGTNEYCIDYRRTLGKLAFQLSHPITKIVAVIDLPDSSDSFSPPQAKIFRLCDRILSLDKQSSRRNPSPRKRNVATKGESSTRKRRRPENIRHPDYRGLRGKSQTARHNRSGETAAIKRFILISVQSFISTSYLVLRYACLT